MPDKSQSCRTGQLSTPTPLSPPDILGKLLMQVSLMNSGNSSSLKHPKVLPNWSLPQTVLKIFSAEAFLKNQREKTSKIREWGQNLGTGNAFIEVHICTNQPSQAFRICLKLAYKIHAWVKLFLAHRFANLYLTHWKVSHIRNQFSFFPFKHRAKDAYWEAPNRVYHLILKW